MAHVTMDIELPQSFIGDVLVTAFDGIYGGCLYWARHCERPDGTTPVKVTGLVENADWHSVYIQIEELEELGSAMQRAAYRPGVDIDAEVIAVGLQRWSEAPVFPDDRRKEVLRELDAGQIDAGDADAIVQYGLFGDIVFG